VQKVLQLTLSIIIYIVIKLWVIIHNILF